MTAYRDRSPEAQSHQLAADKRRRAARNAERMRQGICVRCGKEPSRPMRTLGEECALKAKVQKATK